TDMAIGGGLVGLALVGGGVFWMRRRSENKI
ncbi:LPXTG cell wall anchor domain-containing protein, partial [Streptomyces aurantiacus]